jgi:hypothetical protein
LIRFHFHKLGKIKNIFSSLKGAKNGKEKGKESSKEGKEAISYQLGVFAPTSFFI